jgi:hypothetical protein
MDVDPRVFRGAAVLLLGAGASLLSSGAVLYVRTPPAVPSDAGSVPGAAPGWPAPVAVYPTSRYGRVSAWPPPTRGVAPAAVRLPGGADAAVVPQRIGPGGELGLPDRVGEVGWWSAGAGLDEPRGSVVLAGHVDAASQGEGYFAALRNVPVGARVAVRGVDGRERSYAVTGRRSYLKQALPVGVFSPGTPARLVLVTCTGAFDPVQRSYAENLVVFAVPLT